MVVITVRVSAYISEPRNDPNENGDRVSADPEDTEAPESSEDLHQALFQAYQKLFPDVTLLNPVTPSQEPYQIPLIVVQVQHRHQNKDEIVEKVCGKRVGPYNFSVTIPTEVKDYNPFCRLQINDFLLGSLNIANLVFYQKFTHASQFKTTEKPQFSIAFDLRRILVDFAISNLPDNTENESPEVEGASKKTTTEVYQLRISFSNMEKTLYIQEKTDIKGIQNAEIYIVITSPLELWRTNDCLKRVESINDDTRWSKTVLLNSEIKSRRDIKLNTLLGDSRVLKIVMNKDDNYDNLLRSLERYDFVLNYAHITKTVKPKQSYPLSVGNFDCVWYLYAIFYLGYHTKLQFDNQFNEFIFKHADDEYLFQALERTYITMMSDQHSPLLRTVQHYILNPSPMEELRPKHNCYIRRVVVTPTRKVFLPQSLVHENRILREFDREYAINVSFRNDNFTKLNDQFSSQEFTRETVMETLSLGIKISDRTYHYLGCSGSQLRNHSCWFYAEDSEGIGAEKILRWVGDLSQERLPGKYIARVGQCFSKTKPVDLSQFSDLELSLDEPDVYDDENKYCFTDGVGRISLEMLNEVFQLLDEPYVPSAFQIRLAGCKGMLALDPRLKGKAILIRRSMRKFSCDHRILEIMRMAMPMRLRLNRQIITLLSHHSGDLSKGRSRRRRGKGIKGGNKEFIRLLLQSVYEIADAFVDDVKAAQLLGSRSGFPCPYVELANAGFPVVNEPFFRDMCQVVAKERVDLITRKFNIELPQEQARNMFGVVDETGRLNYGEVFVRYSANVQIPGENLMVVEGKVLVSKMPCLHPGDVRVLTAVDVKELHHHKDCIVFPQKGPRPHPDEMAGSDLDGDEYFVVWMPELMLKFENCEPMDYTPKPKQDGPSNGISASNSSRHDGNGEVTKESMIEYMVEYVNGARIGPIANSHSVFADYLPDNIYSEKCLEICQLHSDIVDSNKTGQVCESRRDLRPQKYPDFMDKMNHKDTYRSKNILGSLFRIARRVQLILLENSSTYERVDLRLIFPGHEEYLEDAKALRASYEVTLARILQEYGVESEIALISNCLSSMSGPLAEFGDDYETTRIVQQKCMTLNEQIRLKFYKSLDLSLNQKTVSALKKASACYRVLYENPSKYRSFAWIFSDLLVEVLKHWNANNHIEKSPTSPRLHDLNLSMASIDTEAMRVFLIQHKVRVESKLEPIYYILLKWYENSLRNCISRHKFIECLRKMIANNSGASNELYDASYLLSLLKTLGMYFMGEVSAAATMEKKTEACARETTIALLRLSLHCDWRQALCQADEQTREISQTIHLRGQNCNMREFLDWLILNYRWCSFKWRDVGRNRLLHVMGPAMHVYQVMDEFPDMPRKYIRDAS